MGKCYYPGCTSRNNIKGNRLSSGVHFFRLPKCKIIKNENDSMRKHMTCVNNIKNQQRKEWLKIINTDVKVDDKESCGKSTIRVCSKHFHESLIIKKNQHTTRLKLGSIPTKQTGIEALKSHAANACESSNFIVGDAEDHLFVEKHIMQNSENDVYEASSSTKSNRFARSKRKLIEECFEQNSKIKGLQSMSLTDISHHLKELSILWKIKHSNGKMKLSRIIESQDKNFEALQTIYLEEKINYKCVFVTVNTPEHCVIKDKTENATINTISNIKHVTKCTMTHTIDEFMMTIKKIEDENKVLTTTNNETVNYRTVANQITCLAKTGEKNGDVKLAAFYYFMCEQIVLRNQKRQFRTYPSDSFTLALAALLHNSQGNRYNLMKQWIPHILLPDVRTIFSKSHNFSLPLDGVFDDNINSMHAAVLAKIINQRAKKQQLHEITVHDCQPFVKYYKRNYKFKCKLKQTNASRNEECISKIEKEAIKNSAKKHETNNGKKFSNHSITTCLEHCSTIDSENHNNDQRKFDSNKIKGINKTNEHEKKCNVFAMNIDEIGIQAMSSYFGQNNLQGTAHNSIDLATHIQNFLLTALNGEKFSISLCSKPVCNQNETYLRDTLLKCLDKASACDAEVPVLIVDGGSINSKMIRMLLETEIRKLHNKGKKIAEMNFDTSFVHNGKQHFCLFCIMHIIKCIRNALVRKNNLFDYCEMKLSDGFFMEAGQCDMSYLIAYFNETKGQLLNESNISPSVIKPTNLGKQAVSPALKLFSKELSDALDARYGNKVAGTTKFLRMINNHIIQPLTVTHADKGQLVKEAKVFTDPNDKRLDLMLEISEWVQTKWYPHVMNLPKNRKRKTNECKVACEDDLNGTYDSADHVSDSRSKNKLMLCKVTSNSDHNTCESKDHDESLDVFFNEKELEQNSDEQKISVIGNDDVGEKAGRKSIFGGLSEETFFSLSFALKSFVHVIRHLLKNCKIKYVLTGRLNNDPIELHFSFIRFLSGSFTSLNVASYVMNERTLLLREISKLCLNGNGSFDRNKLKSFFEDVKEFRALKVKDDEVIINQKLSGLRVAAHSTKEFARTDINLPHIAGYCIKKLETLKKNTCQKCIRKFVLGKCNFDETPHNCSCNTTLIKMKNDGGLSWPAMTTVRIAAIILDTFRIILRTKEMLQIFMEIARYGTNGIECLKKLIKKRIDLCNWIPDAKCKCKEKCSCDLEKIVAIISKPMINIGINNLTKVINRMEHSKSLTMKMVKEAKRKGLHVNLAQTNDENDVLDNVSNWKCSQCQEYLKSHGAAHSGTKIELQNRCRMLNNLKKTGNTQLISMQLSSLKTLASSFGLNTDKCRDELIFDVHKEMTITFEDLQDEIMNVEELEQNDVFE